MRADTQAWRARVETADGRAVLGTGFLIDSVRILTCAHVVVAKDEVSVTFLGAPDVPPIKAMVEYRGPWQSEENLGDIAVLRLVQPVRIQPAKFAGASALHEPDKAWGELHVYGFPRGFDNEGTDSQVYAPYTGLHRAEWMQLESATGRGIYLQKGFSGAAATIAKTGEVVGMIVGAERGGDSGTGKMLPLRRIEHYWPEMGDYLPLGDLPATAGRELRRILATIQLDQALPTLYQSCLPGGLGPTPPTNFSDLWGMATFIADEVTPYDHNPNNHPLARLCARIASRLPWSWQCDELVAWARHHLGAEILRDTAHDSNDVLTGTVSVRVTPSAQIDLYSLSISVTFGEVGRVLCNETLKQGEIRTAVEDRISEAIKSIPTTVPPENVLVQFELPLTWLGKPVDEWYTDKATRIPIGWSYPVVVRDLRMPTVATDRPRFARKRWQTLINQSHTTLYAIRCQDAYDRRVFIARLLEDDRRNLLALSSSPKNLKSNSPIQVALIAGVPVMIWPRTRCIDEHVGGQVCSGDSFLAELQEALATTPPRELPRRIRSLRVAATQSSGQLSYCGSLTLFWYDPEIDTIEESRLALAN